MTDPIGNFNAWEHYCYTTRWIMDNFPPNEDFHHFELIAEQEKEYNELIEFYGNNDSNFNPEIDYSYENDDFQDYDDDFENECVSSSDSEYEEFEYA